MRRSIFRTLGGFLLIASLAGCRSTMERDYPIEWYQIQAQFKELQSKSDEVTKQIKQMGGEIVPRVGKIEKDLSETRASSEKEHKRIESKLDDQVTLLKASDMNIRTDMEKALQRIGEVTNEQKKLRTETQEQLAAFNKDLSRVEGDLKRSDARLTTELAKINQTLTTLDARSKKIEGEIEVLKETAAAVRDTKERVNMLFLTHEAALQSRIRRVEEELRALEKERESVQKQIEKIKPSPAVPGETAPKESRSTPPPGKP